MRLESSEQAEMDVKRDAKQSLHSKGGQRELVLIPRSIVSLQLHFISITQTTTTAA